MYALLVRIGAGRECEVHWHFVGLNTFLKTLKLVDGPLLSQSE